MTVSFDGIDVDWLGYATVRLAGADATIYLDPGRYDVLTGDWEADSEAAAGAHPPGQDYRAEDGDVVCITHLHHYDPDGIERVASPDATLVVFEGINVHETDRTDVRPTDLPYDLRRVNSEDELLAADAPIWTVPAYNDPDGPHTRPDGTPYHPKGFGCGFLVALDGTRIFWPGDTDVLPGHEELDVDLFLPPIGGSFTMDRREAADLAEALDPDLVVPIHYNTFDALETDSLAFVADCEDRAIPVALDES